jgi:flagellar biosynthetic protein FliO
MTNMPKNRFLWVVLGVVLLAVLGVGALSSQIAASPVAGANQPAASATAQPAGTPAAGASFLAQYQDPQAEPAPNTFMTVASLLFKLAIVLGLIYLTILGLRYFGNRSRGVFMGNNAISVLEKTSLAQNRELYLIDVADRVLLLGATTTNISVLTEITDSEAIEELRTKPQPALPSAEPFLTYLKHVGDKVRPIAAEVANTAATAPRELLKPADLVRRIEEHKLRLQERTASLQSAEPVLEPEL